MIISEKQLNDLKELVNIQCSPGNWNYDAYMHGMANGMILLLAIMESKIPEYLEAPKEWLCDIKQDKKVLCAAVSHDIKGEFK